MSSILCNRAVKKKAWRIV